MNGHGLIGEFDSVLRTAAVVMILVGAVVASYAVLSTMQSTPYMVQSEVVSTPGTESVVSYEQLTANQQRVFERTLVGAAPVEKIDLTVFANSVVEYRGEYHTFELFVDEGGVGPLAAAVGIAMVAAGSMLFAAGWHMRRPVVDTSA